MNPVLLTLTGEKNRLGAIDILAIVSLAVTNVIGDIKAVAAGSEDVKTGILNTLVPYLGKYIGNRVWPVSSSQPAPAQTEKTISADKQGAIALSITALPSAIIAAYQVIKKGSI